MCDGCFGTVYFIVFCGISVVVYRSTSSETSTLSDEHLKENNVPVRFEVFTAVTMKNAVF
jgi:hypothetical protein